MSFPDASSTGSPARPPDGSGLRWGGMEDGHEGRSRACASGAASGAMEARAIWLLLTFPAALLFCQQLRSVGLNPGWKDIFLFFGRGLLFLAILTLIISVTTPWLTSQAPSKVCLTVTEEENKRRQKQAREEQQEALCSQSSEYLKNVLKPRQEKKLREREECFFQMMGETWKSTDGYKLGGREEPGLDSENRASGDTPNKEASRRRKLPGQGGHVSVSPEQLRAKKVLLLPEEPPETAAQVLLDWMTKAGYHSSNYTLCTSFPRRPLEVAAEQTLEDSGLVTGTVLNVEEKEPCSSPGSTRASRSSPAN
ncbi:UBX domain-containing protein 8 isoform X3 [Monodelphis domestica]|uniref:UBX domain-containing protein 8 isoform X3 n=1 Tax=Monodelphis domestica TaxID=13616 RepID=UPI0024E235EC|nr:UBX domain-containing protein 8 isoform X3 [Monodelphis domestica]